MNEGRRVKYPLLLFVLLQLIERVPYIDYYIPGYLTKSLGPQVQVLGVGM